MHPEVTARSETETGKSGIRAEEKRGLTAIDGALSLITVLLMVQVWLLTAALEALLAGHRETALPSAIASALLFAATFGLYRLTHRLDHSRRIS